MSPLVAVAPQLNWKDVRLALAMQVFISRPQTFLDGNKAIFIWAVCVHNKVRPSISYFVCCMSVAVLSISERRVSR
jgi:EamA domain-containing membrane protein RarD